MMKSKKRLLKLAYALLGLLATAFLLFPYTRQLVFGPKIEGVPICRLQGEFRRLDDYRPRKWTDKLLDYLNPNARENLYLTLNEASKRRILLSLVDDADSRTRELALRNLAEHAADSDVMPHLLRHFDDPDREVRYTALTPFSRVQIKDDLLMGKLRERIQDEDPGCRWAAIEAVVFNAESLEDAIGALEMGRRDERRGVREMILLKIRRSKLFARADLVEKLYLRWVAHEDPEVRAEVASGLGGCSLSPEIIAAVNKLLCDGDSEVRYHAMHTAAGFGKDSNPFLPVFNKLLDDPEAKCRIRAALFVWSFDRGKSPDLIARIRSFLTSNDEATLSETLRWFPSKDVGVFEPEIYAVASRCQKKELRQRAVDLFRSHGPKGTALLIQLIAMDNDELRLDCIDALREMGREGREAIPVLRTLLEHSNTSIRVRASEALEQIEMSP